MSENIIFKYPLSSCHCYECTKNNYNSNLGGIPTNNSIGNCSSNSKYECYNNINFSKNILPKNECGYVNLNPDMGVELSKDYVKLNCKKSDSKINSLGKCVDKYVAPDPRLIDPIRGSYLYLDRPPYNGEVPLDQVYDKKYTNYGKNYKDYNSVKSGQIMYYYDKSIEQPFFEPIFTIKSNVNGNLYKDPMDNYKPYYTHDTVDTYNPMIDSSAKDGFCLSDISDSNYHREDIISKQMDLTNRTKYTSRWSSNMYTI